VDRFSSRNATGTVNCRAHTATATDTCLILQYHRVASLSHDPLQLAVQPHNFEKQIEYLADSFNTISMDQMKSHLRTAAPFADRTVVVTFDGGYTDILYTAKEVLEKCGVFATVFTPSAKIIEPGQFWPGELEDLFIAGNPRGQLEIEVNGISYGWSLGSRRDVFRTFDILCSVLQNTTPSVQKRIINQIRLCVCSSPDEPDSHRTMDAQELKMLEDGGLITVGGHTHNYVKLSALPKWQQAEELAKNKSVLEEALGHPVEYFSYPFGGEEEYGMETAATLENIGFTLACAGSYGTVSAAGATNRYELPRVKVGNWNPFTFYKFLEGFFN